MSKPRPLVVIVGPTASGKSALAMQIAKKHNGEIIAADSRTIYKGMDIGTAKPTLQDQQEIQHHLLDIREPDQSFSAAEFKDLALKAIDDIHKRGKLPILVGGSGLYIDSVLFDYTFGSPVDAAQRDALNQKSVQELIAICRDNNITIPINYKNKRHLIRAIEIGGLLNHPKHLRANTLVVGITTNREDLRRRITQRAHAMLAAGILEEVERLGKGYAWQGEALKGNSYRVFKGVVEGNKSKAEAVEELIKSDLQLAKRQMTWFKRNPHIFWSPSTQEIMQRVDTFLASVKSVV